MASETAHQNSGLTASLGEVRESDHIDLMHSGLRIQLRAWREGHGNTWSIWRSDTGQTVPNRPDIETRWVDLNSTNWPSVQVLWSGDDFDITPTPGHSHVLRYIGHNMREAWEVYWNPNNRENPFHHTCIRVVATPFTVK